MKKLLKLDFLKAGDLITIIFINILSLIAIYYYDTVSLWWLLVLINLVASFTIIIFINFSENKQGLIKTIRDWYWYPIILVVFKEVYFIIQALELTDKDRVLIYIDRLIFGTDPTHWFMKFSHPVLTEYLQICYSTFYFIILAAPLYAYIKKNYDEYFYSFYIILLGFYISYIGYILVPAIGPRFTLHDFYTLDTELPGLFLYKPLRLLINLGESIPPNTSIAALVAQRDCFPSGHTEMTLLAIYLSFKYKQRIKWILLIVGISLIIATVYLRYHYVIDVFAGAFAALLVIVIAQPISKLISRKP
ncbi:MAG TPA: phosphatase PAP2 family protein [Ignavibacteria bacterium]